MNFKPYFNRRSIACAIVFFILLFFECAMHWTGSQFGRVNMDEIALVLQIGMGGVDKTLLWSFIRKVLLRALMWTGILTLFCSMFRKWRRAVVAMICVALVGLCIGRTVKNNFQTGSFFSLTYSDFYEREYIAPADAQISFPTKRNVLVIALESIEKAYADEELFGPGGLTPNITKMEHEHVSFTQYDSISGLSHTIAAITGFTTGLPLFFTSCTATEKMLGATGIGTIFADNGYNTTAIFPATGQFSLKSNFMHRMGFDRVIDGKQLQTMLPYKLDVRPFHGVDDATLFDLSKPIITDIIKQKRPYFLFMETINTHMEGYVTSACTDMGFDQTGFEGIAKCDDKLISDFVKWFRAQDPSAVIILLNDHAQHSGDIMKKLNPLPQRHLANVFINTPVFKDADMNRPILALDFFPTIIESAGGIIDGCKLGLGVSLSTRCANIENLRERYGDNDLEQQMEMQNKLYKKLNLGTK